MASSETPALELPGVTIGISGPGHRRIPHKLMALALRIYGARSVYIRPGSPVEASLLDGLLFAGGTHINPNRYGQEPAFSYRYDDLRDDTDFRLLDAADELNLPVLGICRGSQLLNVHRGGDLCQDVTPLRVNTRHRPLLLPLQTVRAVTDSRFGQLVTRPKFGANRIHSQAIKRLGKGLRPVAVDNDLFVQAIENTERNWMLGVQFHPEFLLYHPLHRRIFRAFVQAVMERKLIRLGADPLNEKRDPGVIEGDSI